MREFKIGDKVRASFMIEGEIIAFETVRGIQIAKIYTGSTYLRQVPVTNLVLIETKTDR